MPQKKALVTQDQADAMMSYAPGPAPTTDPETARIDAGIQRAFAPASPQPDPVQSLAQSVAYGVQQDPDQYAKLLALQKQTGVHPQLAQQGYQKPLQQSVDRNSIDYPEFVSTNPRTAQWAANPDNAAVSGVPEIQRLGGIEQNVQHMDTMYPTGTVSAYTPTMWESLKGKLSNAWDAAKQNLYAFPLTRMAVSTVGGLAGTAGDVGSFVGWHGDGPTKQNMLQGIESSLKPENVFKGDPYAGVASYAKSNGMDQVAPLLASMAVGVGEGSAVTWAAKTFGWSERAAKVAAALSVGATFSAQQGGAAYTQVAGAGGDDDAARLAANRTFAINLPGNTLAGFADMIPGLKDNPLLAQAGTGALMGASGQVGSNIVTGKPLTDGLLMAMGKAAAIQAGLHLGMSQFHANLAQAVEAANASELKARSPQTFEDAIGAIAGGGPSLRIPVEEFNSYFAGQKIDPQAAAQGLGATNYAEAHLSGGDVEVPKAGYLAKLDQAHQMGLFPHIVDPVSDLTPTQWEQGRQELTEWEAGGGTAKLQADVAAADAETAASPEHAAVKEDLRGRYEAAGETPEVAEALATKDANVFTNLAREANLKPSELVAMYNPKVTVGEAPEGAPKPMANEPATQPMPQIPVERTATPEDNVQRTNVSDIEIDPKRFQFKMNTDAGGVTNLLKGRKWNEDLAGLLSVWKDPADGKTYAVNGHHRATLAKESGVESVWTKHIDVPTAEEARAVGALQNIAEGRGTAMDAAKFFRDSGITPERLDSLGISMGEATAAKGTALAKLDPSIFDQVVSGKIRENRGVAIGNASADPADQEALLKLIQKAESKGKRVSDDTVEELARMVKGAPQHTDTQESLFGMQEMTQNLALEKAEVSSAIREKIAAERRTFAGVADARKAEVLGKVKDQTINAEKNAEIAANAAQAQELYDRESVRSGRVDDILNAAAKELAQKGANANEIKQRAYASVRDELAKVVPGAAGSGDGRVPEAAQTEATGEQVDANRPLFQGDAEQPRGWFRTLPDGSFEIGKTNIGDLSTFVHEPAHAYLHMLGDLAGRETASETLKSDYSKVLKFLDAKDGEALTVEQQEKWAQANEQYLREGKAPSPGLRGVFTRFSVWLGSVYKKASDIGVELSDEIRDVFDRMYAAEEGVNRAAAEAGPHLFRTPEEAGWTEEQFRQYAADNNMTTEQARADIIGRLNEATVRDRSDAWREEERNVREAVTAQVDAQREYKAIRSLRKGELEDGTPLTLLKDALVYQFGEERVKALQELHPGLYRVDGLTDAETAAELHGFSSGEEMMKALEATPRRSVAIDTATRDFMTAKHGDIRYDGTLDDQARLAVENDNRSKALHQELTALKAKVGELRAQTEGQQQALRSIEVAPISAYRDAAYQMVQKKAIVDLQPTRYLDTSRKYSTEAFDAVRRGDVEAAAEAKHKELLNHFLYREAMAEKEFVTKQFTPFVKRVQGKTTQQNLGKAGPEYRAQFNKLMARYEIAFVANAELPEGTLAEWASNQYDMGKEPSIEQGIYDESRTASYRTIPISELHQVHDALMNIRALAYQELRMTVNGRRVEFAQATADMMKRATESLKVRPTPIFEESRSLGDTARDYVQRGAAPTVRTEFLMKRLDGGVEGPWHDNLWHLAADAQGIERKLQEEVTGRIGDALEAMPKEQRMKMLEKVSIPGISEILTRKRLISMALNMGNDGNFDRLTKTFEAFSWNPDALEQVKGTLTREEWQFVQGAWDSLKPLGERMREMEKRLTGVPPQMVKPTPFRVEFADGTHMDLDGGYYPIVMDPKFSEIGAQQDASTAAQNLMESGYGRAVTSKGYTKARSGYGGPMLLDYEQVLTQHLAKVSKDISHREFVLAANKLMMNQEIRQTLRATVGEGYEKQMLPWLRTLVNDRNGSATQGLGEYSDWMAKLRTNLVEASLGFKLSTMLLQVTHASSVFLHTSPASYAQAFIDFMAHPNEMTQQIRGLSPNEMRDRGENIDRDMRAVLQEGIGKPGVGKIVAKAGMYPVKMVDHLLSFPLWLSVYRNALAEHGDLSESEAQRLAMHRADGAVRMGLGSNAPKDLPAIMRKNDLWKLVTTLGGFHNLKLNQIMDVGHEFRAPSGKSMAARSGNVTYGMLMAFIIPAVLGAYVKGERPKDDENPGEWAARKALLFAPETLPLFGDIVQGVDEGRDARFTPIVDAANKGERALSNAFSSREDKDWTGIGIDGGEAVGDLFGISGTAQAAKAARYANRAAHGKISDPNVWDAFVGSAPRR